MKLPKVKLPKYESIVRFLEKRFPEILLILLLLLICIISIQPGKYLLSNDNYSPELNPTLSVSRYLESPAWRGYRVLGFASESEQADVFRSIFYTVFDSFLPSWLIGQLFYFFSMAIGAISVAYLTRMLIVKSKLRRYANWGYLLSGVIYFTTLWTMWLFYQNMAPYIVNFGFFPLLLLSIYKYSQKNNWKNLSLLFFTSILFTATSVIATLFVIDFVFIVLFTIFVNFFSKYERKREIKNVLITLGVFLLTQLFWILPFIHYTLSTSGDIVDSYTNRTITASVIDLETSMQTMINSARLYNRTLFEQEGDTYVFPMAELFQTYDFYKAIGLLPALLCVIGLIFGIVKKNYKLIFWGVLGIGSLFLIKVINPPFGVIFSWLQENIPLFKQVLRWPFSKLGQIYLICLTVLSTFGAIYLIKFFESFFSKKLPKRLFILSSFVLLCTLQLIYSEYMFKGDIFAERALVNVPQEYFELKEYVVKNDQTGRIYHAPPSNNNYFREYEWGFWGSQFISYIIPNPIMDMSSAVGSKVGENALLEISNVVRSESKDELLSLLHRYDVKYVLFDSSIDMEGYTFGIDEEKTKALFSEYELIWSSTNLSLFKVPQSQEKIYTESLSSIQSKDTFVKDIPKYPTLSPLDIEIQNIRLQGNDIVGEFEYKGYSTYMYSNLFKDSLNGLPSEVSYSNNNLYIYPSYPYVEGDASVKPYRSYSGNFEYYAVGNSSFRRNTLAEGITIDNNFESSNSVFGVSQSDFKSLDMLPLLLETKGSDCSGGEVVESTFVTPQEVSSGFSVKGTTESPCVYTGIPIDTGQRNIVRVKINWETESDNYAGFCIYSSTRKKCLNREKFLSSDNLYGDIDILVDSVIEKGEEIFLILYASNISKDTISEVIFRSVSIEYASLSNQLEASSSSDIWQAKDIFLDDGNLYSVHIPVVTGSTGYIYDGSNSLYTIWQPNRSDSETKVFDVSIKTGLYQRVENDYINQTANLFVTNPNSKYLVYWKGENISNIPSSLCLIYDKEDRCWFSDMFIDSKSSSYLNTFNSSQNEKLLNVIYGSTSYKLTTENILKEFAFMKYPSSWNGLMYVQEKQNEFKEYEMSSIFTSPNSTYYKIEKEDITNTDENILVSIPQARSSGWLAVKRNGILLSSLGKDTRVSINDWKQAWDVSDTDFDSISVIYWPNLLSYFGYSLILLFGTYLTIKFIEERKDGNK